MTSAGARAGRVAGRVALVTGAASGLGRATALMLAKEGAKVAVSDIDRAGAERVAAEICAAHAEGAVALGLDVTDEAQWRAAIEATVAAFGGLHVLVNNAGIGLLKPLTETTLEEWRRIHAVDLDSVFLGCRDALGPIEASGGGSIINIASVAGVIAAPNLAAYNSAKAAVIHLTRSVALTGAARRCQVRCNAILPAFIDTPILDPLMPSEDAETRTKILGKLARQIPLGAVGEPDDVAYAVVYLASEESKFMTGTALLLDGGVSAQ